MASFTVCASLAVLVLCCWIRLAAGHRTNDERERVVGLAEHSEGLEDEHSFEVISSGTRESSGSAWKVTTEDKKIMEQLLETLNPPGADSNFTWQDDNDHWTFGLVQLTAQTAKGSLALHMLHRHGLASLLAARAAKDAPLSQSAATATPETLGKYVEGVEKQSEIQDLRELLLGLSLSGLRNLHSYDHQWSVDNFQRKVEGCSQREAGGCILQAGTSKKAYDWLAKQGFSPRAEVLVEQQFQGLMGDIMQDPSLRITYQNLLTPYHTGRTEHNTRMLDVSQDDKFLTGSVYWEDGGRSRNLRIDITPEKAAEIKQADAASKDTLIEAELQRYIERMTSSHKSFMGENRLKIWTHETAEFAGMYPKYRRLK